MGYDRLFREDGTGRFVHDFGGGIREFGSLGGTDVEAANRDEIAITPVTLPTAARLPEEVTRVLETRER